MEKKEYFEAEKFKQKIKMIMIDISSKYLFPKEYRDI